MTRLERAAEKVRKAKEKREALEQQQKKDLDKQRTAERAADAEKRLEEKKALTRRRHAVGDLAERAGLFVWSNDELRELFALLAVEVSKVGSPDFAPWAVQESEEKTRCAVRLFSAKRATPWEEADQREVTKKGLAAAGVPSPR